MEDLLLINVKQIQTLNKLTLTLLFHVRYFFSNIIKSGMLEEEHTEYKLDTFENLWYRLCGKEIKFTEKVTSV